MKEIKYRAWLENINKPKSNEHMIWGLDNETYNKFIKKAIENNPQHEDYLKKVKGVKVKGGYVYRLSEFFKNGWLGKIHYMEYTGHKDKNDKPIYEDDIVTHKYRRIWKTEIHTSRVVWDNKWSCFYLVDKHGSSHRMRDDMIYEIIGNLYQNPELL